MDDKGMDKDSNSFRKKRIKMIKRVIVLFIATCILVPTIVSIVLMIKVRSLQEEVARLSNSSVNTVKGKANESVVNAKTKSPQPSSSPENKVVYLTFEDGPSQQTERILDILKKESVKATFYVVGHTDKYSKKLYRRIVSEGHTLGLHSYSHIYQEIYKSKDSFLNDLEKLQMYLYKITGVSSKIYRFPGGSSYQKSQVPMQELIDLLHERGILYQDWNVVNGDSDTTQSDKDTMIKQVLSGVRQFSTSIVQMHDSSDMKTTADSLESIITELKQEGYQILPIDENTTPIRHAE